MFRHTVQINVFNVISVPYDVMVCDEEMTTLVQSCAKSRIYMVIFHPVVLFFTEKALLTSKRNSLMLLFIGFRVYMYYIP